MSALLHRLVELLKGIVVGSKDAADFQRKIKWLIAVTLVLGLIIKGRRRPHDNIPPMPNAMPYFGHFLRPFFNWRNIIENTGSIFI